MHSPLRQAISPTIISPLSGAISSPQSGEAIKARGVSNARLDGVVRAGGVDESYPNRLAWYGHMPMGIVGFLLHRYRYCGGGSSGGRGLSLVVTVSALDEAGAGTASCTGLIINS